MLQKQHHLELFLSVSLQAVPAVTPVDGRARMGSQIRKLCRGNVASGSVCRTSLGRLPLQPTKGHLCPRRWYSAASTFVWSLCSSQMAFPPHMEVTEDYPENFISVSAIGSPLSDSNNFFSPLSFLPCPLPSYCNSDSIPRHRACSYLPRTVY